MSRLTGVRTIMRDIKQTVAAAPHEPWINLSAGNPVVLPALEAMWRRHAEALLAEGAIVGRYGETEGYAPLIDALIGLFRRRYGWELRPENVLVAPGSRRCCSPRPTASAATMRPGDCAAWRCPRAPTIPATTACA
ncbi:MAG TPA: hypothetical protein VF203_12220 [Burkholderiales bacterium]